MENNKLDLHIDNNLPNDKYYSSEKQILFNMDCLEALQYIPNNSVDLIITDPPYRKLPKGAKIRKEQTKYCGGIASNKDKTLLQYNSIRYDEWLPIVYEKLKDNSHCYIFASASNIAELQIEAEKVGFKFQQLIVNNRKHSTPSTTYMNTTDFILLFVKGKREIRNMGTKNLLDYPSSVGYKIHPQEKSLNLIKIFVRNSSYSGNVILDPFYGSGATGKACLESGRLFIGCEIDKYYYDKSLDSLQRYERIYK